MAIPLVVVWPVVSVANTRLKTGTNQQIVTNYMGGYLIKVYLIKTVY